MPRAIWSGAISFGLVNIPVKLYTAVTRKTVRFNQLDARTNSRIRQKRVAGSDGTEVPPDQLVRGYEVSKDNYVVVSDDELAALQPEEQHTIDIEEFVDLVEIDPVFYDNAYILAPENRGAAKPYALLARAMEETGKVAIAHFVMRQRSYLAAVRPRDDRLLMSTMVYADELNDPAQLPELADLDEVEVTDRELQMAEQLIDSLAAEFDPEKYHDTYREAVLELIDQKAAGEEVAITPGAPAPEKVVDLMAALEASVAEAKEARTRHPTAHSGDGAKAPAEEGSEGGEAGGDQAAADSKSA